MKRKGSLRCPKELSTRPYNTEPDESRPYLPILFNITLPPVPPPSEHPIRHSNLNFLRISHLHHARYMPLQSQPPSFYHLNNIW